MPPISPSTSPSSCLSASASQQSDPLHQLPEELRRGKEEDSPARSSVLHGQPAPRTVKRRRQVVVKAFLLQYLLPYAQHTRGQVVKAFLLQYRLPYAPHARGQVVKTFLLHYLLPYASPAGGQVVKTTSPAKVPTATLPHLRRYP